MKPNEVALGVLMTVLIALSAWTLKSVSESQITLGQINTEIVYIKADINEAKTVRNKKFEDLEKRLRDLELDIERLKRAQEKPRL